MKAGPGSKTDWSMGGNSGSLKITVECIHWDFIFLALEPPINTHHKREPFEIHFLPWGRKIIVAACHRVNQSIGCMSALPRCTRMHYHRASPRVPRALVNDQLRCMRCTNPQHCPGCTARALPSLAGRQAGWPGTPESRFRGMGVGPKSRFRGMRRHPEYRNRCSKSAPRRAQKSTLFNFPNFYATRLVIGF